MLKICLSDGAITTSATLSEQLPAEHVDGMRLSFSEDRNSLLLTGEDDNYGADHEYIGADDLSTHFDAHSIIGNQPGTKITSYGQAISVKNKNMQSETIVFLADGTHEPIGDNQPIMVRDGWYYYKDSAEPTKHCYARKLTSGQTVELSSDWHKDLTLSSWHSITSDQQEIITLEQKGTTKTATVRLPDAPSIALSQDRVEGVSILGDVLYTSYDPDNSDSSIDHLVLTSVSTGKTIIERDVEKELRGPSGTEAVVTPWGTARNRVFCSAAEWLDWLTAPASSSSSGASAPSGPSSSEPASAEPNTPADS